MSPRPFKIVQSGHTDARERERKCMRVYYQECENILDLTSAYLLTYLFLLWNWSHSDFLKIYWKFLKWIFEAENPDLDALTLFVTFCVKNKLLNWGLSVDSSSTCIFCLLQPRVRIPSTPSNALVWFFVLFTNMHFNFFRENEQKFENKDNFAKVVQNLKKLNL